MCKSKWYFSSSLSHWNTLCRQENTIKIQFKTVIIQDKFIFKWQRSLKNERLVLLPNRNTKTRQSDGSSGCEWTSDSSSFDLWPHDLAKHSGSNTTHYTQSRNEKFPLPLERGRKHQQASVSSIRKPRKTSEVVIVVGGSAGCFKAVHVCACVKLGFKSGRLQHGSFGRQGWVDQRRHTRHILSLDSKWVPWHLYCCGCATVGGFLLLSRTWKPSTVNHVCHKKYCVLFSSIFLFFPIDELR